MAQTLVITNVPFACSDLAQTHKNAVFSAQDCYIADNTTGLGIMCNCAEYLFLCMNEFSTLLEWGIALSTDGTGVGWGLLSLAQWGNSHWWQWNVPMPALQGFASWLAHGHLQGKGRECAKAAACEVFALFVHEAWVQKYKLSVLVNVIFSPTTLEFGTFLSSTSVTASMWHCTACDGSYPCSAQSIGDSKLCFSN